MMVDNMMNRRSPPVLSRRSIGDYSLACTVVEPSATALSCMHALTTLLPDLASPLGSHPVI